MLPNCLFSDAKEVPEERNKATIRLVGKLKEQGSYGHPVSLKSEHSVSMAFATKF